MSKMRQRAVFAIAAMTVAVLYVGGACLIILVLMGFVKMLWGV